MLAYLYLSFEASKLSINTTYELMQKIG